MNSGIITLGALVAVALIAIATKPKGGVGEYDVEADEIREGVQNGWYTAGLFKSDAGTFVILRGKMTNGEDFVGSYPISEDDWNALYKEGYPVEF